MITDATARPTMEPGSHHGDVPPASPTRGLDGMIFSTVYISASSAPWDQAGLTALLTRLPGHERGR